MLSSRSRAVLSETMAMVAIAAIMNTSTPSVSINLDLTVNVFMLCFPWMIHARYA
jgi:hypothetical protein